LGSHEGFAIELGLVRTGKVHYGVNYHVVVLVERAKRIEGLLLTETSELAVDFEWGVVEFVVEGHAGPSVEDCLEVGADALTVGVDLISFSFFV